REGYSRSGSGRVCQRSGSRAGAETLDARASHEQSLIRDATGKGRWVSFRVAARPRTGSITGRFSDAIPPGAGQVHRALAVMKKTACPVNGDLTKSVYMYIHLICELRRLKRNT